MLSADLQRKLDLLPPTPGVYLMKDRQGEVVYVGKARSLKARVAQYFQPQTSDTRRFIPFLEELLGDLEVMLTPSEKDALLLENELIKKHQPRFNVRLRDDKNFISLRLSRTHPYPRLEVVRRIRKDGARYFGPYSSASSIRESLQVLNRHFQLRTCTDQVMANRRRPCLQFQIKRCPAPCVYEVPEAEYQRSVDEAALFLEGKADELKAQLGARMKEAARSLEFERAASLRDQLQAIERSLEKQRTVLGDLVDQDVVGFHREGALLEVHLLFFRNGRLNGGRSFSFARQEFPTEELIESFLEQYYDGGALVPKELLLPLPLASALREAAASASDAASAPASEPAPASASASESVAASESESGAAPPAAWASASAIEAWLSDKRGERVHVHVPERGEKRRLVEMATENARHSFDERQRTQKNALDVLTRLQSRLRLQKLPRRIECFDMSTFQGQLTVGSQVAFTDGEPDKSRYRLYKVRGAAAQDDFASMFQVLTRRLVKGRDDADLPDLILVDGGKGQLSVARAALKEAGLTLADVALAGLAKSRVLEDEQRFAARQGFSLASAWEEKAGPEPQVEQIAEEAAVAGSRPSQDLGQMTKSEGMALVGQATKDARLPIVGQVTNDSRVSEGPAAGEETPAVPGPPAAGNQRGRSRQKGRFSKDALERSPERVFLPGQKNPLVLRQNTSEMFLLQRLRDEAHRFAITFHRKLRRERNFRSVLEEIPGIGDKRKRALLAHFGSLKRIRAAGSEEIAAAPGFNAELAERVRAFLAGEGSAKATEAEAAEAAEAAAESAEVAAAAAASAAGGAGGKGGGRKSRAGAKGALEREDVAFDAAAAELAALEEDVDEDDDEAPSP